MESLKKYGKAITLKLPFLDNPMWNDVPKLESFKLNGVDMIEKTNIQTSTSRL